MNKRFKKISAMLALTMMSSLSGCGSKDKYKTDSASTHQHNEDVTDTETTAVTAGPDTESTTEAGTDTATTESSSDTSATETTTEEAKPGEKYLSLRPLRLSRRRLRWRFLRYSIRRLPR